jgi:uncharacterized membrane protein YbaN (DUF454 family)
MVAYGERTGLRLREDIFMCCCIVTRFGFSIARHGWRNVKVLIVRVFVTISHCVST